jgi:hypothetical protein
MDLKGLFTENYKVITGLLIFVLSLLIIAIKSYFSERGRLKAQISENKKLVEQTEKIKSKFNKELEEYKKEHQLEISKRKYQYESKKEQYIKFFMLLDEFSNESNSKTQQKFIPIVEEFNRNYLNATSVNNKRNETNAITTFQKKIQQLMFDANKDLIRIKQETNTIRIIASNDILHKLDLLTMAYDKSLEATSKMMKNLLPLILDKNQEKIRTNKLEIEIIGIEIKSLKEEIINLMRKELGEI